MGKVGGVDLGSGERLKVLSSSLPAPFLSPPVRSFLTLFHIKTGPGISWMGL